MGQDPTGKVMEIEVIDTSRFEYGNPFSIATSLHPRSDQGLGWWMA